MNLSEKLLPTLLIVLTILWIVCLSTAAVKRHDFFYSNLWDLGWQEQVVWNTAQGRILQSSMRGDAQGSFLEDHVTLVPLFLAPIYRILPHTETLLVTQAVILSSGSLLLYLLAQKILKNRTASFLVALTYLISPLPVNIAMYDFHEIVLVVPVLMGLLIAVIDDKRVLAALLAVLALTIKEEVALTVLAIGLVALVWKKGRLGIFLICISLIWFGSVTTLSGRFFSPGPLARRAHRYPRDLVSHLSLLPLKLRYLIGTLGMFGFLPLLGGLVALTALPALLYNTASTFPPQLDWHYHYTAPLLAPLFAASIVGLGRLSGFLKDRWHRDQSWIQVILALGWLWVTLIFSLVLGGADVIGFLGMSEQNADQVKPRRQALQLIPDLVPVSVGNSLGAHLAQREGLYDFPRYPFQGDWVIFATSWRPDQGFEGSKFYQDQVSKLNTSKDYRLMADFSGVVVYKKVISKQ